MSDKIKCPYCQKKFDVDLMDLAQLWQDRAGLAARLGPVWQLANEYLDAFRVKPDGRLTLKRRIRHLGSLAALWEQGLFEVEGKRYRCSQVMIRESMTRVCELEKFGFKNHNYLKRILLKAAGRVSAEGLTAKEERDRDIQKMHTASGQKKTEETAEDKEMTAAEYLAGVGAGSLTEMIGGRRRRG